MTRRDPYYGLLYGQRGGDGSSPQERFARGDDDEPLTIARLELPFGPPARPLAARPARRVLSRRRRPR